MTDITFDVDNWLSRCPDDVPGTDVVKYHFKNCIKCYTQDKGLLPTKATQNAAGWDLRAAEDFCVEPGKTTLVKTGLFLEIPEGFVGKIHSRSGLSTKNLVVLVNGVGVVDSDFRGEICVALTLLPPTHFYYSHHVYPDNYRGKKYDRIAQLLLERVEDCYVLPVKSFEDLSQTDRGSGGFGSTGK